MNKLYTKKNRSGLIMAFALAGSMLSLTPRYALGAGFISGYRPVALNYVDLSDDAVVTAQPIQTQELTKKRPASTNTAIVVALDHVITADLKGIGGAFNEQGGEAFMSLPEAARKVVVKALFHPQAGAGLTLCRTAVGASDFGLDAYSYSETADDYDMQHFSVERDTQSVLPFIRAAKAENPELRIFASPWSPPGWMKVSGKMEGGNETPAANVLKNSPQIYKAYALYFSKYVQAYAEHGVIIDRLLIQNEPDMNPKYPGCDMSPEQMSVLIADYVRPRFIQNGLRTEIWAGTFRGKRSDAKAFMAAKQADKAYGVGLQYCPPRQVRELRSSNPDLKIMHTEGKCFNSSNTVQQARSRFAEISNWLNAGCENFCYWNMVLNENSESGWGWKQNSLIKIDRQAGTVTYNPDFAPVALLSRFIRPGDELLRVKTPKGTKAIAVRNNCQLVVFLQNDTTAPVSQSIDISGREHTVELPAQSLCAITFKR